MAKLWNRFILPASLLAGTIIGAGVFSLPYVYKMTGALLSGVYALFFCFIAILIYYMYIDLLRAYPGERYVGLMKMHFGPAGYIFGFIIDIAQFFLSLTIYVTLSASFLSLVIPGYPHGAYIVFFWLCGSVIIFLKNRREAIAEFVAMSGIAVVIFIIVWIGFANFPGETVPLVPQALSYALLPFGALLFSFSGRSVIPDVVLFMRNKPLAALRKAVVGGVLVPLVLYVLFVAGIMRINPEVSSDSVSGLLGNISPTVLSVIGVLGILTLLSSYLALGENIRKTLMHDMHVSRLSAGAAVVAIPIVLYAMGMRNFLIMVSVVGGILAAFDWLCILIMWKKSFSSDTEKKDGRLFPVFSPVVFWGIVCVLCVGIVYTVWVVLS